MSKYGQGLHRLLQHVIKKAFQQRVNQTYPPLIKHGNRKSNLHPPCIDDIPIFSHKKTSISGDFMGFFMGFPNLPGLMNGWFLSAAGHQPSGYPAVLRSAEYNGSPQPGAPHAASTGLASFSLWNTLYNTMFSSSLETNAALDAPYFDVRSKNMFCAPYWNEPGISASVKQVWFPAFCVKKIVDQEGGHRLLSPSAWQILPSGNSTLLWTSIFNKYIITIVYTSIYIYIFIYKWAMFHSFNKWPLATVPSISGYCVTRG